MKSCLYINQCIGLSVSMNTFGNASECMSEGNDTLGCGQCGTYVFLSYYCPYNLAIIVHVGTPQTFLYTAGVIVVICVVLRLVIEFFQFLQLHLQYLVSFENWLEILLYSLSLIFVSALWKTCVCPAQWQWEIGALVVFLAWIHLCIFIRKLPQFGLYIVMFEDIVETFIKITVPAFLLVLAFSMAFYMMFFVPSALFSVSPEFNSIFISVDKVF